MPSCRTCGVPVPPKRRYCDLHRAEQLRLARQDYEARKLALQPQVEAAGFNFNPLNSLGRLYQLAGIEKPTLSRKARVPASPRPRLRKPRRGWKKCANPACPWQAGWFFQRRRAQRYCQRNGFDCKGEGRRIEARAAKLIAQGYEATVALARAVEHAKKYRRRW